MNVGSFLLIALSVASSVAGQILFKHAMHDAHSRKKSGLILAAGVVVMAVGFFVWLRLLSLFDLSFLYPFEGLDRLFILPAAAFFLREKITPQLWIGVVLIVGGVVLVAAS